MTGRTPYSPSFLSIVSLLTGLAVALPATGQADPVNLFPIQPRVPTPSPLEAVPSATPPTLPPQPPPLPFRLGIKWQVQGESQRVLLVTDAARVVVCRRCADPQAVRPGQPLAPEYRLVDIDETNVTIEFLPLKALQHLPLTL